MKKSERLIYLLVELGLIVAILFVIHASVKFAYGADMILTCAPRPLDKASWWSYRLVNGRACWYRGKHAIARERLHWNHTPSEAGQSTAPAVIVTPTAVAVAASAFECTWRKLMDDLKASLWMSPNPATQWSIGDRQ